MYDDTMYGDRKEGYVLCKTQDYHRTCKCLAPCALQAVQGYLPPTTKTDTIKCAYIRNVQSAAGMLVQWLLLTSAIWGLP